jgi:integrase
MRFKSVLDGAGLARQRFHNLRHCAAFLMLAQEVPMRVVMHILGHTQLATTVDLYRHVMPAAHREVADLTDAVLCDAPQSTSAANPLG